MMKEFSNPEIEITRFQAEDVIATSNPVQNIALDENQTSFK